MNSVFSQVIPKPFGLVILVKLRSEGTVLLSRYPSYLFEDRGFFIEEE